MNKAGMIPTVRYRLPGHTHYVHIEGRLCPLAGFHELAGREGFVMAPFAGAPLLLLPDDVREVPLPDACPAGQDVCRTPRSEDRAAYSREFRILQEALQSGRLEKVVLSRRARMATGDADAETLFLRACHVYPDCYVCLFDTPQTGCWLTASPELLLAGRGAEWETMALAGTLPVRGGDMPRAEDFGAKNLREQALVTR
ncbi:MAG: chorismate-binding protein, partial [Alloprevotella sp.]|nr:chorismate-binding protein [Alloprevotella sp.]